MPEAVAVRPGTRDLFLESWQSLMPDPAPNAPIQRQMEEMVLLFREYLDSPSEEVTEDVATLAYELAVNVLEITDRRGLIAGYRDALANAAVRHVRLSSPNTGRKLLAFFNLVTDSYWRAHADRLRRALRFQHRESLGQELRLAKRIQQRLLPKEVPAVPGFDIAGRLIPATEVGGDYWSVKSYPEDGVVTMKLADIGGHGIAAAMLVAAVKYISGGYYRTAESAHWVIERTNHVLVKETPSDVLVTMFYAWLRPERRTLDVVNAGHHPVLFMHDGRLDELPPTGPLLGLTESQYREIPLHFGPDDLLFVCSDGVIEARGAQQFGTDRLKEVLQEHHHLPCSDLITRVIDRVTEFAGQPQDDISVLAVKALPGE